MSLKKTTSPAKPKILITGAAGRIGSTLRSAWASEGRYDLTLLDLNKIDSEIIQADIRQADQMKIVCQNQDVLVHLANIRYQDILKDPAQMTDITASMLLFETARQAGISKIIYASTNHVTGWNEKLAQALNQRISGGGKEIDFMLTPKSLGRLRVSMSMIEGQLSLAIKTDTAMAAAMLGDAESQLVQMLEARDLRVASFAASTSGQPGQQNDGASQGDTSSNGEGRSENEDDIDAVEQVSALTADDDGINVTA